MKEVVTRWYSRTRADEIERLSGFRIIGAEYVREPGKPPEFQKPIFAPKKT